MAASTTGQSFFYGEMLNPPAEGGAHLPLPAYPRAHGRERRKRDREPFRGNRRGYRHGRGPLFPASSLPGERSLQADVLSLAAQFCASAAARGEGELEHFMRALLRSIGPQDSTLLAFLDPAHPSFAFFEARNRSFEMAMDSIGSGSANPFRLAHVLKSALHRASDSAQHVVGQMEDGGTHCSQSWTSWFDYRVDHRASFFAGDDAMLEPPIAMGDANPAVFAPSHLRSVLIRAWEDCRTSPAAEAAKAGGKRTRDRARGARQPLPTLETVLDGVCGGTGGPEGDAGHALKRQRSASHGGPQDDGRVVLAVQYPDRNRLGDLQFASTKVVVDLGQIATVEVLKATVLAELTGLPPGKIKVHHPVHGFLKDREWLKNCPLAAGESLRIEVKTRGGGKTRNS